MQQVIVFETEDHSEFRTLNIDGEPWFVLADVCRALDLKPNNGSFYKHAVDLDRDEKRLVARSVIDAAPSPLKGEGLREAPVGASMLCISESGFYELAMGSKKPQAKRLRKWVTSEVLPSIRRTGSYSVGPQSIPTNWQPFHDRISACWGAVPEGYFSIFKEMADLMATLIGTGVTLDHKFIPDISVGQCWGRYWTENGLEHDYGVRLGYLHSYPAYFPQAKSNPQLAHCYPEEALTAFRRWFRRTYLKVGLPDYLARQVQQKKLPAAFVKAALAAVDSDMGTRRRALPK